MDGDAPLFAARGDPAGRWWVEFPDQVGAWVAHLAAGRVADLIVRITDADDEKTRLQENGFHAMIRPWSVASGKSIDALKQIVLAHAFGTFDYTHPSTGLAVTLLHEPSTARLSKKKYSQLIETALQLAAEDSPAVYLLAPDEYRLIKETEQRRESRREAQRRKAIENI